MVNLFRKLKKITKQSSAPYQKNGHIYGGRNSPRGYEATLRQTGLYKNP